MGKKSKHNKKPKKCKSGGSKAKKRHSSSSSASSSTSSSSSSSSSSSDSNLATKQAGYRWEDKTASATPSMVAAAASRSDWFASISEQALEANLFLGSTTSSKIRAAEKERKAREVVELGAGLVINRPDAASASGQSQEQTPMAPPPPQNSDWYRRAYRRCQEQAREEGRPMEEVAAERWGSLDRLRRLMEAERPGGAQSQQQPRWKRRQQEDKGADDGRPPEASDWRRWEIGDNRRGSEADSRRSETEGRRSEAGSSDANWRRSETDSRRSETDSRRSETDSRRSETDSRRSETDTRRSETDSRRSETDTRRSETDSRRSETESWRSKAESSAANKQRTEPEVNQGSRCQPSETDTRTPSAPSATTAKKPDMVTVEEERHVCMDDINQLSAQILRAQMEGDAAKAGKLEKRLAVMREAQRRKLKVRIKQRVPKKPDAPATAAVHAAPATAAPPRRPGLNALGEAATIEELRAHERLIDSRAVQLDFAGAWRPQTGKHGDADDPGGEYGDETRAAKRPRQLDKAAERDRDLAGQKLRASGRRCGLCLPASEGHSGGDAESAKLTRGLMIECGPRVYLRLPETRSLVDKHCLLSTLAHVACCAQLDDDAFADLQRVKRRLVERLGRQDLDCVFVEMAKGLGRHPHLLVEAFPLPREVAETAAIYFRKAMMEAGPEWATNRKAVPLREMDIRRTVPRGFAYLAVEFGRDSGLVHVIEDEAAFPDHFGREVVAGMLDLPHELWRRPKRDNWEAMLAKASEFRFFWSDTGEVLISQG